MLLYCILLASVRGKKHCSLIHQMFFFFIRVVVYGGPVVHNTTQLKKQIQTHNIPEMLLITRGQC